MIDCPMCGEYSSEDPNKVIGHMTGKSDEAHKGIGRGNAQQYLNLGSQAQAQPEAGGQAQPQAGGEAGSEAGGQAQATDGGVVPAEYQLPSEPSSGSNSSDDDGEEYVTCPGCSSDRIVEAEQYAAKFRTKVDRETLSLLNRSDFVCWDCGGIFDDG